MRKHFYFYFLLFPALLGLLLLAGCGGKSADQYVGEQITAMKEEDPGAFTCLLEQGRTESNALYTLQFPQELRTPTLDFLQEAFRTMEFEVTEAMEQSDSQYSVDIAFTPIDVAATTSQVRDSHLASMASPDLTAEVSALYEESAAALEDEPQFQEEIRISLIVEATEDGFAFAPDQLLTFLQEALPGYMQPYNSVCEVLDARDFLQSYLDASFKGDVSQFALHTDRTEEEALEWYEADVFTPPADLSPAYHDRYSAALKEIMKQCQYTVGIPRKESGLYNYTVDITTTPNNSIVETFSKIEKGTYYSLDAVSKDLVETMESYAKSPAYGEETTLSIPLNMTELLAAGEAGSTFTNLSLTILPVPQ